MTHAIEARGLVKTYGEDVRALDGLGFEVDRGSIFGLLGPNGAGKTTTVKVLTTLAAADEGEARVVGMDVRREPGKVRRRIGVVSQRSGVDEEATGRENLLLQARLFGFDGSTVDRSSGDLLDRFGLAGAADRAVKTYSGGMQRRLDVALGLVGAPEVLFLDEPTTGLDPEVRSAMWAEIVRLAHDEGLTILLTTHYLEEADRLADRLAIVDRGRMVIEGTPDGLKGELRGDALQIDVDVHDVEQARRSLATRAGVRDLSVQGHTLFARVDDGARALPSVLAVLADARVRVASATIARPSLDDVYLRHTGKTYDQTGGWDHDAEEVA